MLHGKMILSLHVSVILCYLHSSVSYHFAQIQIHTTNVEISLCWRSRLRHYLYVGIVVVAVVSIVGSG